MSNPITRTAATALSLVGDAAAQATGSVRKGVARWVPQAVKMIGVGTQLAVLRDGSRKVAKVAKRNPTATAAAITVAATAGIALWLLQRNRRRRGLDEDMRTIEVKPVRMAPAAKTERKRAPRKAAAKRETKVKAGA